MSATERQRVTVSEFEQFIARPEHADRHFELLDGVILEKIAPTGEHSERAAFIAAALVTHVRPQKLGRVGVEMRHGLPDDRFNSLIPDVSFLAGPNPRVTEGAVPQMPDLDVEIRSPGDSLRQSRAKAEHYLLHGTRIVWLVDPTKKLVIVLTPDDEQIMLEHETLDGGDVLPGFRLPVRDIFADPLA